MASRCTRLGALLVVFVAVLLGATIHGVPRRLGLFRWLARVYRPPALVGLAPAMLEGEPRAYTLARFEREVDLTGQTALVTGANSGLGFVSARQLARRGARVILACRNTAKCADAARRIRHSYDSADVDTVVLDTSSFASVRACVAQPMLAGQLDVLMLNAGIAHAGGEGVQQSGFMVRP